MSKASKNLRAVFSFTKIPEKQNEYFVRFRWGDKEESEVHTVPENQLDTIRNIWPLEFSGKADPRETGRKMERQCNSVGTQLTTGLVFSPKCQPFCRIKKLFEEFDEYAVKMIQNGGGPPELSIVTDMLDLPWELTYAPLQQGAKREYWCERYIVSRTLPFGPPGTVPRKEKKAKVLVITKPSYEEFSKKDVSKYPNFLDEYEKLEKTIRAINLRHDVDIKFIPVVDADSDLSEIQKEILDPYDLVVFIGVYSMTKGGLKVRQFEERDHYIYATNIIPNFNSRPVFFLDACSTEVAPRIEDKTVETFANMPLHFLGNGASAFLGTFQQVEMVFAHAFARFFLSALFEKELSLAGAVHKARKDTYEHFANARNRYASLRMSQCPVYTLYCANEDVAFRSPAFKNERVVEILWPDVLDDYYACLETGEVVPSETRKIFTRGHEAYYEIEQEIRTETNVPTIVDLPIITMSRVLKEEPQKYVIIGSIFAPLKDDCAIFIINGDDLSSLKNRSIYHAGNELSVTTFLRLLLSDKKIEKDVDMYEVQDYRTLENNFWTRIKTRKDITIGTVLAGESCLSMDEAIRKFQEKSMAEQVSGPIWIRQQAIARLKEKYFVIGKNEVLDFVLPATVIVARKDEVLRDPMLYYSVLKTLDRFLSAAWGRLQLRANQDVYQPDVQLTKRLVKDLHLRLTFMTKEMISGIVYFTRFVKESKLVSLKDRTSFLVERPLEVDDFIPLNMPEGWEVLSLEEIRKVVALKLEQWKTDAKKAIDQAKSRHEQTKEHLPLEILRTLDVLEKGTNQIYDKYKLEIKETTHKILLGAILTKIGFLEAESNIEIAELTKKIRR